MRMRDSGREAGKFQPLKSHFFAAMDFIILPIISKPRKLNYW